MTPGERAVEAGAEAMHDAPWRRAGWALAWHAETAATQDAYRQDALLALRGALRAFASDSATAGLCAADLAAEVAGMEVKRG